LEQSVEAVSDMGERILSLAQLARGFANTLGLFGALG
jgi:hypothetical protein